ncbi:TIGR00730 family Rossman fold protein [Halalkalibaculum sp. DA3122]|uniref:LOG family protein n=1 Tax=unclassified Halalkalibaculum TaxID=2964617 RepID=UPI003753FD8F
MIKIKRVCVFCGSKTGRNPAFATQARTLGKALATNHIDLVYGGGSIGLMNVIADAVLSYGASVHGVIPEHLMSHAHGNLTALHVTDSMHERKAMMAELSDAFIALPGGFGTFEELLETITWVQLGLHEKPVLIFNMDGYYDLLVSFIDQAVDQGFITKQQWSAIYVISTVDECLELLTSS